MDKQHFNDKYKDVNYYRQVKGEDKKHTIIKYQEPNGKCVICSQPSEWIAIYFHQIVCSDECLQHLIKDCNEE